MTAESVRDWKRRNPERVKSGNIAYQQRRRAADPARYKAEYQRANAKRYASYAEDRVAALTMYGGICECCGEGHKEFLAFDHRNGGGNKERQSGGYSGHGFIKSLLKKRREDIRVLCHNCNMARAFHGCCPHEKE